MPAAPISLYIDLEPGRVAELEVVARASLEFAQAIREIAFMFDPSLEIRIELERGEEGSLSLKALVRWVRGLHYANPTLYAVVMGAAAWFLSQSAAYTYEKLLDHLMKSDEPQVAQLQLTPEQMEELAKRIDRLVASRAGERHIQGVYRELARDPAVRGVGVTPSHHQRPTVIIPREEFAARSGQTTQPTIEEGATRTLPERGIYTIIKPVLKDGGGKWRLSGPNGEFSATIKDQQFLDDIMNAKAGVPLAAQVRIDADIEIEERFTGAVWQRTGHKVIKVYSIDRQPSQAPLFPLPSSNDQKRGPQ